MALTSVAEVLKVAKMPLVRSAAEFLLEGCIAVQSFHVGHDHSAVHYAAEASSQAVVLVKPRQEYRIVHRTLLLS